MYVNMNTTIVYLRIHVYFLFGSLFWERKFTCTCTCTFHWFYVMYLMSQSCMPYSALKAQNFLTLPSEQYVALHVVESLQKTVNISEFRSSYQHCVYRATNPNTQLGLPPKNLLYHRKICRYCSHVGFVLP